MICIKFVSISLQDADYATLIVQILRDTFLAAGITMTMKCMIVVDSGIWEKHHLSLYHSN